MYACLSLVVFCVSSGSCWVRLGVRCTPLGIIVVGYVFCLLSVVRISVCVAMLLSMRCLLCSSWQFPENATIRDVVICALVFLVVLLFVAVIIVTLLWLLSFACACMRIAFVRDCRSTVGPPPQMGSRIQC